MTSATLSFATPRRVRFVCSDLRMNEWRDLETDPPFALWTREYMRIGGAPEPLLELGLKIGAWLDGNQRWLVRLHAAAPPIKLVIETANRPTPAEREALIAPWELIAEPFPARTGGEGPRGRHLASDASFHLARRIGPAATVCIPPSEYRLSLLFMAAQPDGLPELAADVEEASIRAAAGGIDIDVAVNDSGGLYELGAHAARVGKHDVLHLLCYATRAGGPVLLFEGTNGACHHVTTADLSARIVDKPRLLLLSACSHPRSAETEPDVAGAPEGQLGVDVLWPMAIDLCIAGWPAVLAWPRLANDPRNSKLTTELYRQFAQRASVVAALAHALVAIGDASVWHYSRLFLTSTSSDKLVDGTARRPDSPIFRVPGCTSRTGRRTLASSSERFEYRTELSLAVDALRECATGLLIHGGSELARTDFVDRVLNRLQSRAPRRVVVNGNTDATTILSEIKTGAAQSEVAEIVDRNRADVERTPEKLEYALCEVLDLVRRGREGRAFALVVHDFSLAREGRTDSHALAVARALIRAFRAVPSDSFLIVTVASLPSVDAGEPDNLARALLNVSLGGVVEHGAQPAHAPQPASVGPLPPPAPELADSGAAAALVVSPASQARLGLRADGEAADTAVQPFVLGGTPPWGWYKPGFRVLGAVLVICGALPLTWLWRDQSEYCLRYAEKYPALFLYFIFLPIPLWALCLTTGDLLTWLLREEERRHFRPVILICLVFLIGSPAYAAVSEYYKTWVAPWEVVPDASFPELPNAAARSLGVSVEWPEPFFALSTPLAREALSESERRLLHLKCASLFDNDKLVSGKLRISPTGRVHYATVAAFAFVAALLITNITLLVAYTRRFPSAAIPIEITRRLVAALLSLVVFILMRLPTEEVDFLVFGDVSVFEQLMPPLIATGASIALFMVGLRDRIKTEILALVGVMLGPLSLIGSYVARGTIAALFSDLRMIGVCIILVLLAAIFLMSSGPRNASRV